MTPSPTKNSSKYKQSKTNNPQYTNKPHKIPIIPQINTNTQPQTIMIIPKMTDTTFITVFYSGAGVRTGAFCTFLDMLQLVIMQVGHCQQVFFWCRLWDYWHEWYPTSLLVFVCYWVYFWWFFLWLLLVVWQVIWHFFVL